MIPVMNEALKPSQKPENNSNVVFYTYTIIHSKLAYQMNYKSTGRILEGHIDIAYSESTRSTLGEYCVYITIPLVEKTPHISYGIPPKDEIRNVHQQVHNSG